MNIFIIFLAVMCIISFTSVYSYVKEQSKPDPKRPEYITRHPVTGSVLTRDERILMNDDVRLEEMINFAKYDIDPRAFEVFCCNVFREFGHVANVTKSTNDQGRDIIVDDNIFIECKQYKAQNSAVGREICQKLLGSVHMFNAEKGIIINTGEYHKNAYEVEKQVNNLELWDLRDLEIKLSELSNKSLKNIVKNTMHYINVSSKYKK